MHKTKGRIVFKRVGCVKLKYYIKLAIQPVLFTVKIYKGK